MTSVAAGVAAALLFAGAVLAGTSAVEAVSADPEIAAASVAAAACVASALGALVVARRRGSWVCVRVIAYAAIAAAAAVVLAGYSRRTAQIAFSVASAGAGLALVFGPRLPALVDRLFLSGCVAAVAAEVGLRAVARVFPSPLFERETLGARERIETYRPKPGELRFGFPVNSTGHYDAEFVPKTPDVRLLVLSIGDSFASGVVPHSRHFTTVCERELPGVVVDNMGVPAIGPWEYRELLISEGLPLHPDVIVVNLFVGNDVGEAAIVAAPAWPESWLRRESLMIALVPRRLVAWWRESRVTPTGRRVGETPGENGGEEPPSDPMHEEPTFSVAEFRAMEALRATIVCGEDLEPYVGMRAALAEIRRAAGAIPLFFQLIPDEFQVEDDVWSDVCAQFRGHAKLDRDQPQRIIRAWCEANGVAYIDLLPELRAVSPLEDGRRHCYMLRNTHFNVRGNRIAGETLARGLRSYLK